MHLADDVQSSAPDHRDLTATWPSRRGKNKMNSDC